ncbi:hypothetical protein NA56DRAFT_705092 [Hyaloscypha hepaticicola]|uniref:Heterokaryon incompatibility domain-containing protein n=1 Tax=Hyaloscypha hepaticicola TaxID=2082293 RepID=A0A2J6Q0P8_9HELO|nr:hypothetical protein NA56DRAFT_705092 [Hyaloscypha hepaticicola]
MVPVARSNLPSGDLQWSETMDILHQLVHARKLDDSLQRARFMANCKISYSDPRDKIYAFLGCTSLNYSIVPDYSPAKSVRDLFMESSTKTYSLPSWTPDWTSAVEGSFFYNIVHWSRLYWNQRPPDFEQSSVKFRDDPVLGLGSKLDVSGYCIKIWDHVSRAPGGPVRMTWIYEIKESYVVLASHEILAQDELWILPGT